MFGDNVCLDLITQKKNNIFSYAEDCFFLDEAKFEHDILFLPFFIKKSFADSIIDFAKNQNAWQKAVTYGEENTPEGAKNSPRQAHELSIGNYKELDQMVHSVFGKALGLYRDRFEHIAVESDEGYSLLKYSIGGHYKPHSDASPHNPRQVSGLIYLNDDYEGGEIHFSRQDYKIKPNAGSVVIFPSFYTHLHSSLPITKGTKYAIVTWFK